MDYITHAKEYVSRSPYGDESVVRETSVLASVNYSYDDRYLLDATYRANASSSIWCAETLEVSGLQVLVGIFIKKGSSKESVFWRN